MNMLPKKDFVAKKTTLPAQKQLNNTVEAAKKKPYIALGIIAAVPLLLMIAFTFKSGLNPSAPSKKIERIVVVKTPLEVADEATAALQKNDINTFLDIISKYAKKDVNIVNSQGDPLLLVAASLGNYTAVEELLSLGADVNKMNAATRDTALLRSIYYDFPDITRRLIYSGANINMKNNYNHSPMFVALEKQNGKLIDLLLNSGAKEGVNADYLFRAVMKKNNIGVLAMLKGGVSPDVVNAKGNTPLIIAASLGDVPSVRRLLEYRADLNLANKDGNTALIYAARYNHPEVIRELLHPKTMQIPADIDLQNNKGQTALWWGASKGYTEVVKRLLAAGADPTLADNEGNVPYVVAQNNKRGQVLEWFDKPLEELQKEVAEADKAAMIAQAKAEGREIEPEEEEEKPLTEEDLLKAIEEEDTDLAKKVLDSFDRSIALKKDKNGVAVFLLAVEKGNTKLADLLLDKGARIFESSPKGNAFHIAVQQQDMDMLKYLLEKTRTSGNLAMMLEYRTPIKGVQLVSPLGMIVPLSPLGLAAYECDLDMYNFLVSQGAKPGNGTNSPSDLMAQCKSKPMKAKKLKPSKDATKK